MYKKDSMLGLTIFAAILVIAAPVCGWFYDHPVIMSQTVQTAELGENYSPFHYIDFLFLAGNTDVEIIGQVDTTQKGTYEVTLQARKQEIPLTVTVVDTKAPELNLKTLKVDTEQQLTIDDFIDSVSDAQDYTVEFIDGTEENLTNIGTSKVTIRATDVDGNTTKASTSLQRVSDITGPTIHGVATSYEIIEGKELDTSQITVSDDLDPRPTLKVDTSEVQADTLGTYTMTVTAKDATGNTTKITRKVNVIENPEWSKNIVYLTFDDGPSANTQSILDILDKYNVKATFFVTGQNPDYFDMIKEISDSGHSIGVHSYTHDYSQIYTSAKAYYADLDKMNDIIEEQTGERTNLLRFPGGSSNTISWNYKVGIMSYLTEDVQKKGYQYFDWNVTSSDATGWGVSTSEIISSAEVTDGGNLIILMHDAVGKETTVEALPKIIEYYQKLGYEFRALTTESYPAHHSVGN
jgi:peptidoglycan/xylan/chitin deacetylase (PgdA/CDA1 family)